MVSDDLTKKSTGFLIRDEVQLLQIKAVVKNKSGWKIKQLAQFSAM